MYQWLMLYEISKKSLASFFSHFLLEPLSAFDQNPERQLEGIQVDRTFTDRVLRLKHYRLVNQSMVNPAGKKM